MWLRCSEMAPPQLEDATDCHLDLAGQLARIFVLLFAYQLVQMSFPHLGDVGTPLVWRLDATGSGRFWRYVRMVIG